MNFVMYMLACALGSFIGTTIANRLSSRRERAKKEEGWVDGPHT